MDFLFFEENIDFLLQDFKSSVGEFEIEYLLAKSDRCVKIKLKDISNDWLFANATRGVITIKGHSIDELYHKTIYQLRDMSAVRIPLCNELNDYLYLDKDEIKVKPRIFWPVEQMTSPRFIYYYSAYFFNKLGYRLHTEYEIFEKDNIRYYFDELNLIRYEAPITSLLDAKSFYVILAKILYKDLVLRLNDILTLIELKYINIELYIKEMYNCHFIKLTEKDGYIYQIDRIQRKYNELNCKAISDNLIQMLIKNKITC